MKEIQDIIRAFNEAQLKQQQTALATVVHVEGSSYRRPGARMLVTDDGRLTGAISGGCLEGDALRQSPELRSSYEKDIFDSGNFDQQRCFRLHNLHCQV